MQKILLIDDNADLISTLFDSMKQSLVDVDVKFCYSSSKAIELIKNNYFDLFIIDYFLDELNGIDLIEEIKKNKKFLKSKFLIITGKDKDKVLENKFIKLGYNYLLKPFELHEFISSVKMLLQVKAVQDEEYNKKKKIFQNIIQDESVSYDDLELFLYLLHNTNDGLWKWDLQSDRITGSHNLWRNFGIKPGQKFTKKDFFKIIHPDDVKKFQSLLDDYVNLKLNKFKIDLRIKNSSGKYKWFSYRGSAMLDNKGNICKMFGVQMDISTDKLLLEKYLSMAYHDELTGIPNRLLLFDRANIAIENAARNSTNILVIFLDLNNFKLVNDNYGHKAGDLLLQLLAQRINQLIRKMDTFARYGGDEFVIMLPHITDEKYIEIIIKRILEKIREPFDIYGEQITISASLGKALYPDDGDNIHKLINHADLKMYSNKRLNESGRN